AAAKGNRGAAAKGNRARCHVQYPLHAMRLRKLGHACVRLEQAGVTLVLDPGSFSAPDALDGANAVLITHEHVDHVVADQLRAAAQGIPDLRIWTNPSVADLLAGGGLHVETVASGDRFQV